MKLYTNATVVRPPKDSTILRVTRSKILDPTARAVHAVVGDRQTASLGSLAGYGAVIWTSQEHIGDDEAPCSSCPVLAAPDLGWLTDGDVVAIEPSGFIRVLYRRTSAYNALLATEQCNSRCLMCSQPPKARDDSFRVGELFRLVELMDPETRELGITGGEPTVLGDDFIRLIGHCKDRLPRTAVHVLSNGRLFYYEEFAQRLAAIRHPDLMIGIPLYSDIDWQHDHVVQALGAFDHTVMGIHNLARFGVRVEIRVVVHRLTYARLPALAEFIYRNMPFAAHVALMGMEMVGYVHRNLSELWIDPYEYREQLQNATLHLAMRGMNVSIYNHQLCILPKRVWRFAKKSISDWKNVYLPLCAGCSVRSECGGFFQSAVKRHSAHVHVIQGI